MNVFKIKGLFLVVLAVALAFVIAWPTSFVFGWTYTNIFDGRTSDPNESFLMLISVFSVAFPALAAIYDNLISKG